MYKLLVLPSGNFNPQFYPPSILLPYLKPNQISMPFNPTAFHQGPQYYFQPQMQPPFQQPPNMDVFSQAIFSPYTESSPNQEESYSIEEKKECCGEEKVPKIDKKDECPFPPDCLRIRHKFHTDFLSEGRLYHLTSEGIQISTEFII